MAVKAATLGAQEAREAFFTFPITEKRYTLEGDLEVYGPCTDGSRDADHQKVDPEWSAKALRTWITTGGNIRVQHSPFLYPAGKGQALEEFKDDTDSHWLKALVLRSTPAFDLVEKGVLRDFSIGVLDPVTVFNDPAAPAGTICGGMIGEVSLVDRGSNKNTSFTIVKAAKDGPAELVLRLYGAPAPSVIKSRIDGRREAYKTWTVPVQKRKLKSGRVVDSSGKDRSGVPDNNFAGPEKTYPIENREDVSDAASLAHHADNPGQVRSNIRSIARRELGMSEEEMPPSLKAEVCKTCKGTGKIMDGNRDCPDCSGPANKGPFPGASAPFGKKPETNKGDAAEDYPGDKGEDSETVAEYNADADDGDDSDDDGKDKDKADKVLDPRKLRRKLIKRQRRVLAAALAKGTILPDGGSGRAPDAANWQPDPAVTTASPARAKGKKMKPAKQPKKAGAIAEPPATGSAGIGKSAEPPSFGLRLLHDATCPAFAWKQVRKAYGLAGVEAAIPERELQTLAMKAIGDSDLGLAGHYAAILELVGSMQAIGPELLLEARKAFPELYPNVHPAMRSDVRPSQFTSGYVSAGHPPLHAAGAAAGGAKLPDAPVRQVSASQFQRGFLDGSSSMSPSGSAATASAGTAAFGQALTTLAQTHSRLSGLYPDMCPVSMTQMDLTQAEGQTGIRASSMSPAPLASVGETGRAALKAAPAAAVSGPDSAEALLRKKLAKAQLKMAGLKEENQRLGSLPSLDAEDAAYRGIPELGGPVDRKSLVGKSLVGDEDQTDDAEYRDYLESMAGSGDPRLRVSAQKVLTAMITK